MLPLPIANLPSPLAIAPQKSDASSVASRKADRTHERFESVLSRHEKAEKLKAKTERDVDKPADLKDQSTVDVTEQPRGEAKPADETHTLNEGAAEPAEQSTETIEDSRNAQVVLQPTEANVSAHSGQPIASQSATLQQQQVAAAGREPNAAQAQLQFNATFLPSTITSASNESTTASSDSQAVQVDSNEAEVLPQTLRPVRLPRQPAELTETRQNNVKQDAPPDANRNDGQTRLEQRQIAHTQTNRSDDEQPHTANRTLIATSQPALSTAASPVALDNRIAAMLQVKQTTVQSPPPVATQKPATHANELPTDASRSAPPAFARAVQVEQQVRFENSGLASPNTDSNATSTSHPITTSTSPNLATLKADNSAQHLPTFSAQTDEQPITAQVTRGLHAMINQRGGVMTMRLDPPEFGELRVQMTLTRGTVTAAFHASNPQAQALLEQNLASLRTALESQGMTVERLVVHAQSANSQQSLRDESQMNGQHHRQQQHDASQGESRGRRDEHGNQPQHRRYTVAEFANAFTEVGAAT